MKTPARVASIALLTWAGSLGACSSHSAPVEDEVQKEDAERQALLEAMKNHPALNGSDSSATGKPIEVPTTIPPKPKGSDDHHAHGADPHSNHM